MKKRAAIIVLDSVGIGAMPDAGEFGDAGAHTLGNINAARPLNIPNLTALGIGNIENSRLPRTDAPTAAFGRAAEVTKAKDTTSGHWEMAGLAMKTPFRTYPNGFPKALMEEFERKIGRGTLGNKVASGTVIIQELGDEHVATGKPIVYTSADSVFQIAAHEDVIPLEELYKMCETARAMLTGDNLVGRVIARPFIGSNGKYTRKTGVILPFSRSEKRYLMRFAGRAWMLSESVKSRTYLHIAESQPLITQRITMTALSQRCVF